MAIKFIDLCSGIGGFHSGLTATGHYECVGHAEIDPHASKAYAAIYGKEGGLNYGDLRKIKPKKLPDFDLLCAGFSCQSWSAPCLTDRLSHEPVGNDGFIFSALFRI